MKPTITINLQAFKDAHAAATKLSHVPLTCNRSLECYRCGASGAIDSQGKTAGAIFAKKCGG